MNDLLNKCKWVMAILLLTGCVHQMELSRQTMRKIDSSVTGKTFWLKQSLYAGTFYDDDRYKLLHAQAFDELAYVAMPDGETVLPPKAQMVIPVGTRVKVEKIEWPDLRNYMNRPLFSPRDLPWMKLKVALDRGKVSIMRPETFIFLIPISSDNADVFEPWFRKTFSDKDTNDWFLSLKPEIRAAILRKGATVGMSRDALLASLGEPLSWSQEFEDEGKKSSKEIANYKKQVVVLENGQVTKIQALTPSTPEQFHKPTRTHD